MATYRALLPVGAEEKQPGATRVSSLFGLFVYVMGAVLLPHAFFITRATKTAWGVFVVGERIRPYVCVFPLHGHGA